MMRTLPWLRGLERLDQQLHYVTILLGAVGGVVALASLANIIF